MQNAECRNADASRASSVLHSAFCILHSIILVSVALIAPSAWAQAAPGSIPPVATEPAPPGPMDIEIGYRTLSLKGSEDLYRTQINERSGIFIRTMTLLTSEPVDVSWIDRVRIDGTEIGPGSPASALRLEADKYSAWRLLFTWRRTNSFSALPNFANPLFEQGVFSGQHTYDRQRDMMNAQLDLLPRAKITPFIGFGFRRLHGPGTSTFTTGTNEFRLSQDVEEREREYRVGSYLDFGSVRGSITQGWRRLRSSETWTLLSRDGSNGDPILDHPTFANDLQRQDHSRANTPFTNATLAAQVNSRVRLKGSYVRYSAETNDEGTDDLAGSFISLPMLRFFNVMTERVSSSAKKTVTRGSGKAEVLVHKGVTVFAQYQKEHRDIQGTGLLDTLYQETLNFDGFDKKDIETIIKSNSSINRRSNLATAGISFRPPGPLSLRFEARDDRQKLDVAEDLAEIVLPGNQSGTFDRHVKTLDGTVSFMRGNVYFGVSHRRDRANLPVFRSDFLDRDRTRLRAIWRRTKWLHVSLTAADTRQSNDHADTSLHAKSRQYGGDFEVLPWQSVSFHGSVSRFTSDSSILIRHPETFIIEPSIYAGRGTAVDGGVTVRHGLFSFDANAGRFRNSGENPFTIRRATLHAGFEFPRSKAGMLLEYARDRYSETHASFADYTASRIGIYATYKP